MINIFCCWCKEIKNRNQLELRWNPYMFKRKAYCKDCDCGALIVIKN